MYILTGRTFDMYVIFLKHTYISVHICVFFSFHRVQKKFMSDVRLVNIFCLKRNTYIYVRIYMHLFFTGCRLEYIHLYIDRAHVRHVSLQKKMYF